jgi:2-dehydro-3-deoxyphosphogluconate aldolase/(4S)-4-hydroxy-2-oxoglutarate aldolase
LKVKKREKDEEYFMNSFTESFNKVPIIGILRGIVADRVVPVIDAAVEGGLTCIEITLNTPDALDLIAAASGRCGSKVCLGAGTVLTAEDAEKAIDAGAQFIVAPNTNRKVIDVCKKRSVAAVPGALTPTEVRAASEAGADLVKVFPVSALGGPSYIRELRGPFNDTPLLACGGVTLENLEDFMNAGASGIALGARVFRVEYIARKEYEKISEEIRNFVKAMARG